MTTELKNLDFAAKIISNFRITIPPVTRSLLELEEGDVIEVEIKRIIKKHEVEATV